jgi:steroid 5-alpha reductase family enzyme
LVAVAGEAIADRQLQRFRENPANRGQVCQTGLWRYSRHPNYFCEWLHWWAYVACSGLRPVTLWGLLGPLAMWWFLNRVTGIPPTEAQSLKSRGEAYRRYQQTTSRFFPWPPRAESTP